VEEFNFANLPIKGPQVCIIPKWNPPPIGSIKKNVDVET